MHFPIKTPILVAVPLSNDSSSFYSTIYSVFLFLSQYAEFGFCSVFMGAGTGVLIADIFRTNEHT